jgi:GNAT superfamily N-acetyltransferase
MTAALAMQKLVTTTHLEMTSLAQLRPAPPPATPFQVMRAEVPCPELNRFLYVSVGGPWIWYGRLVWNRKKWMGYLDRPELETWLGYARGTPVGYFELERQARAAGAPDVEIAYFGLLPAFIGQGLGGALLTAAIERAWQMGAGRVWVHTCDLDHPSALANYQARGMTPFKVEQQMEDLPEAARDWDFSR